MGALLENQFIQSLVAGFPRNPGQLNALLESDAELIPVHDKLILAITADSLVEEIETGLYADPFLIGWMTVMANLSDLAAVGARPLGLILIQHLPEDLPANDLEELQRGVAEACRASGTYILGGDTNTSKSLQMGATALGLIEDGKTIMRRGCQTGDILFASATLGEGNAFAFSQFFGETPRAYQPVSRLHEGALVRKYGSACIDTSDGFFPAIANLITINKKGFEFHDTLDSIVSPSLSAMAQSEKIPSWFFLAGPHGEFELLFTIPAMQEGNFLREANSMNWLPIRLGTVVESPSMSCQEKEVKREVNPFPVANLFSECGGDPDVYLKQLFQTNLYES